MYYPQSATPYRQFSQSRYFDEMLQKQTAWIHFCRPSSTSAGSQRFRLVATRFNCKSDDPSFTDDVKIFKFGDDRLDHFYLRCLSTKPDLKRVIILDTEDYLVAVKRINDAMGAFLKALRKSPRY